MENDLQFYCLNVRGAGNKTKRQSIFSWLKSKGNAIIFLQECHSDLPSEKMWCNEWGNKIFFFRMAKQIAKEWQYCFFIE